MNWSLMFFVNSILFGIGLAMDAFSVSLADGLREPQMKRGRLLTIAGLFGGFQGLMPLIGWFLVHTVVRFFEGFLNVTPWIALVLLLFIGGNMLREGIRGGDLEDVNVLSAGTLLLQAVATSIDALSVGISIVRYSALQALVCALIIAVITFGLCVIGLRIGRRAADRLQGKAQVLGGVILILLGIEICLTGVLG